MASKLDMVSFAYARELRSAIGETNWELPYGHARLRDIRLTSRLGRRVFAVVRNPFSRVVSRYAMAKKLFRQPALALKDERREFRDFLLLREEEINSAFNWHRAIKSWWPALDYITDNSGNVAADVIRFEHLATDIEKYFGITDWDYHENRTLYPSLRSEELFTRETQGWIERWFATDFDFFGFTFYSAATRNFWAA